jgi:hypothetical protein
MSRILVHFSRGAASAVAWKIAVERFGDQVEAIYRDLSGDEHVDGNRFQSDVERWVGQKATMLRHADFRSVEDCWRHHKFIISHGWTRCSAEMKRELGEAYQRPNDRHVFGYTIEEFNEGRPQLLERNNPDMDFLWLLIMGRITKEDCYHILTASWIELPEMYKLGYSHNNCIGCCRGGKGYWNKVRVDFPDVFSSRAKVQREIGIGFKSGDGYFFLDELKPGEGNMGDEPKIECGIFCNQYEKLVELTAKGIA